MVVYACSRYNRVYEGRQSGVLKVATTLAGLVVQVVETLEAEVWIANLFP